MYTLYTVYIVSNYKIWYYAVNIIHFSSHCTINYIISLQCLLLYCPVYLIQYSTIWDIKFLYGTASYNKMIYSTKNYIKIHYGSLMYSAMYNTTMQ